MEGSAGRVAKWLLAYLVSVTAGCVIFVTSSVVQAFLASRPSGEALSSSDFSMLVRLVMFWLAVVYPASLLLAALPCAVGCWLARWLHLRSFIIYMVGGGACARVLAFAWPEPGQGTIASWVAGGIGGLVFWRMLVGSAERR